VGETVRFEVTNAGAAPHEFYLGDADEQAAHADEMAEMEMAHDDPNGVSVDPGATETLEYTFDQAGEIFAGCHEPGHYEAGMVASLTVAGE
ncbi:MAG TPA: plastocyanin/azurin family copper-binding protein, partial [Patescibacteria group bacterium]|nr:plastocyanin/azurin family copper-binding protein [Patescibacteria group bacterium]